MHPIAGALATHREGLWDEAALVTSIATALGVITGFILGWRKLSELHRGQARIYEHVNNVEEMGAVPDGDRPVSLGSLTRDVRTELGELRTDVREGFKRNDAVHELLTDHVTTVDERVSSVERRVDVHRTELDELGRRLRRDERPSG